MAMLFMTYPHPANVIKAWDWFFAERAEHPCAEVETGDSRYTAALRRYICCCIDMKMPPAYFGELAAERERLISHLLAALNHLHDPEQRVRLTGALRWIYENLQPPPPEREARQRWRLPARIRRLTTA
jgi:hypothetical protein